MSETNNSTYSKADKNHDALIYMIYERLLEQFDMNSDFFSVCAFSQIAESIECLKSQFGIKDLLEFNREDADKILHLYHCVHYKKMNPKIKITLKKAIFDYLQLDENSGVAIFGENQWNTLCQSANERFSSKCELLACNNEQSTITTLTPFKVFAYSFVGAFTALFFLLGVVKIATPQHSGSHQHIIQQDSDSESKPKLQLPLDSDE